MPADSLYGQHYSVSALADRLRQERFEHQGAMADRRGAWASLLSLFRLVVDGGGSDPAYLPARHGELFDPDTYPFLEGRKPGSSYKGDILTNLPSISDEVVDKVLTRLLWLADESKVAQRLNYRSLDVEQIGSVYEGIMGFTVERASGPSVGITYRPPRQKITITVVVNAEQLLQVAAGKREKWLDEQAGVALKLPAKAKEGLKQATSLAELCLALGNRLSPHTPNGLAAGSLILQPTAERRRSGSHYTPRALTEPIVAEAFRPWLERCNHQPTAKQILALKVCDPATDNAQAATRQRLEAIGERYHQFRSELMVDNNEGLTSTYNRFHDPGETSNDLLQLRALHQELDQAVLHAYGWRDVLTQAIADNPHRTPAASASITSTPKKTPNSPNSCKTASTQETCSSGMPAMPSISRASCRPPAPSAAAASCPGATAGLMPFVMTCWLGCWR